MELNSAQTPIISETPVVSAPSAVPVIENQLEQQLKPKKDLTKTILFLTTIVAIAAVAFFVNQNSQLKRTISDIQQSPTPSATPVLDENLVTTDPTSGWETYQDAKNGFSLKYPNGWSIMPGGGVNPWIDINSPDVGPKGSQDAHIGMSVNIKTLNVSEKIKTADLKQLVSDDGVLKNFKVETIVEDFTSIQNHEAFEYEYEGTQSGYLFHYWGMNVANDKNIISILITDFKEDKTFATATIAEQILGSFEFSDNSLSRFTPEPVPAVIATLFAAVNKDLSASVIPTTEDQFYSLSGMLDKKSWKLDLTSVLTDKPFYTTFRNTLERELMIDNNKGADGPGMSVQGYENDEIECFMITGTSSYLTCALK